jgi:hypothetical protein
MHLVDDDTVDIGNKGVARRVVFARRRVRFFRRHHQNVGAFGAARVEIPLAGDDVDGVAQLLKAIPLGFFLVCQRAHGSHEQRGAARPKRSADRQLGECGFAGGGRRAGDNVVVSIEDDRQGLALHPVELLKPEGVGELGDRVGNLHDDSPAGGLIEWCRGLGDERRFLRARFDWRFGCGPQHRSEQQHYPRWRSMTALASWPACFQP